MPRFRQTSEILKLMGDKERIRNIGVIAHIDHGKTTMTDSLLAEAGLLPSRMAGSARALDYLEEEQKRGITIKTANISLLHETDGQPYVINLVDTPGHVDFTGKVTRALRATDGAVVVVDAVEEIMAQTDTVTRQALEERVKPVLFINKVDRLIREMKLSADEIQGKFSRIIRDFNNLVEVYGESDFKDKWKVNAEKDSVAFGSALDKWGFTYGIAKRKQVKFGDVLDAYGNGRWRELSRLIPLHDAILDMAVTHLPSPATAQKYRVPKIWKGRLDSEVGQAMLSCNENGPMAICITNVQTDTSGLVATGRLFSGSVEEAERVHLVGAGREYDVRQVSMYMGAFKETVNRIPAGNIAALSGFEMARAGETVVDSRYKDFMVPFEPIRYVSEPIVTIAVEPKNLGDLQRLVEAINRLSVEDPNLATAVDEETGQYLISGMGELHLEIALKLLTQYGGGIDLSASKPIVAYRETVQSRGKIVVAKSPNKRNAFWVQVEPLGDEIVELVEKGLCGEEKELRQIRSILREEAGRVWALDKHGNMLLNLIAGVSDFGEMRDSIISGFHWACKSGPLCEEPLRGVKVKLTDVKVHEESGQDEAPQVMRAVSRAILGSVLTANPCLLEPIYRIEVSVPTEWMGTCAKIITRKKGNILTSEQRGALTRIVGYVPVTESFGLATEMRSATSGRAFWQSVFDHWEKTPETIAKEVVRQIRQRRGLPPEIPKPEKFTDDA